MLQFCLCDYQAYFQSFIILSKIGIRPDLQYIFMILERKSQSVCVSVINASVRDLLNLMEMKLGVNISWDTRAQCTRSVHNISFTKYFNTKTLKSIG